VRGAADSKSSSVVAAEAKEKRPWQVNAGTVAVESRKWCKREAGWVPPSPVFCPCFPFLGIGVGRSLGFGSGSTQVNMWSMISCCQDSALFLSTVVGWSLVSPQKRLRSERDVIEVESPSVVGTVESRIGRFNGSSGEPSHFRFKMFSSISELDSTPGSADDPLLKWGVSTIGIEKTVMLSSLKTGIAST
jgi:hypothetical protein